MHRLGRFNKRVNRITNYLLVIAGFAAGLIFLFIQLRKSGAGPVRFDYRVAGLSALGFAAAAFAFRNILVERKTRRETHRYIRERAENKHTGYVDVPRHLIKPPVFRAKRPPRS